MEVRKTEEIKKHMDKMRITQALKKKVPSAADAIYENGEKVLVWREKGHSKF